VGIGDPLEAALPLAGRIAAGTWHLVGDGIVLYPADVRYDVIWRHGGSDTLLATVSQHFEPLPTGPTQFDATPFAADVAGSAADAKAGDQLVWRFSVGAPDGGATSGGFLFIPNGDGINAHGSIPSLTLPKI
jgi:hypothetical protein